MCKPPWSICFWALGDMMLTWQSIELKQVVCLWTAACSNIWLKVNGQRMQNKNKKKTPVQSLLWNLNCNFRLTFFTASFQLKSRWRAVWLLDVSCFWMAAWTEYIACCINLFKDGGDSSACLSPAASEWLTAIQWAAVSTHRCQKHCCRSAAPSCNLLTQAEWVGVNITTGT